MRRIRIIRTESFRLAALFAILFAGSMLLLMAAVYWIANGAMNQGVLDSINADISTIEDGYRNEGLREAIEIVHQRTAAPGFPDYYLLQSPDGRRLAGNLPAMPTRLGFAQIAVPGGSAPRSGCRHALLGTGGMLSDGTYMFVGEDITRLEKTRTRILSAFGWITGATILLAIVSGMTFSAGFLKRLDAITKTCRAIMAGQLSERIRTWDSQDELDQLAGTINTMLDRIATLMESLRQVSSDIAHDLRTPLTHLRQKLEIARRKAASTGDYAVTVEQAIADCDGILSIFSALLRISQIEAGTRRASFAPVDLTGLLRHIMDIYLPVAEDRGQKISADLAPQMTVNADRALLLQMFSNLVENAIRHAGMGAAIRILCRQEKDETLVEIIDNGPGIPAGEREKVFRRLYRLEADRGTPGNGLGLALVAAIAQLHEITLALSDAQPGLRVSMTMAA